MRRSPRPQRRGNWHNWRSIPKMAARLRAQVTVPEHQGPSSKDRPHPQWPGRSWPGDLKETRDPAARKTQGARFRNRRTRSSSPAPIPAELCNAGGRFCPLDGEPWSPGAHRMQRPRKQGAFYATKTGGSRLTMTAGEPLPQVIWTAPPVIRKPVR